MRKDIDRVIIDCYRSGNRSGYPRRSKRFDGKNIEEHKKQEGIRIRYGWDTRRPGDKLGAIKGFLKKNVGRPWDKVYSEIRENLSHDSMSQSHVLDHIDGYVETHTKMDGKKVVRSDGTDLRWWADFFVHPVNGLLMQNKESKYRYRRPEPKKILWNADKTGQYRNIDGIWYEVELKPVPDNGLVSDILLGCTLNYCVKTNYRGESEKVLFINGVSYWSHWNNKLKTEYGGNYYAVSKRQLNSREIKQNKLKQES